MLAYYLKFLTKPVTKKKFRELSKPGSHLWVNATLSRMRDYGWAQNVNGKWCITKIGLEVYDDYLGIGQSQHANTI